MKVNTQNNVALGTVTCSDEALKEFIKIMRNPMQNPFTKIDDTIIADSAIYKEILSARSLKVPYKGNLQPWAKVLLAKIIGEKSQIECLDYSNNNFNLIDKTLGSKIIENLCASNALKALDLSGNYLGQAKFAITSALKGLRNLKFLDLSKNDLDLNTIQGIFGIAFKGTTTKIKISKDGLDEMEYATAKLSFEGPTTLLEELKKTVDLPNPLLELVGAYDGISFEGISQD